MTLQSVSEVRGLALVDSGADINVLPFEIGQQLGLIWDDCRVNLGVSGVLGGHGARGVFLKAEIEGFAPVELAFAWTRRPNVPMILGQVNFFQLFDVCFHRSRTEFEIRGVPYK